MNKTKTKRPPKSATLSEQLRWYIDHDGDTMTGLAERAGVHRSGLSRFAAGHRSVSEEGMDKLAKALKLRLVQDR